LGDYSSESNLALNKAKAKWMLVSTRQMSRAHALHNYYPAVSCNRKLLERVTTAKIQGVHMDEHLTWADHVTALLSSCYAALAVLRKLRSLAPYRVHKQLVESLVMSKLDHRRVVFYPLPEYHNEMAPNSSNKMRGLRPWAVYCFRGLVEIKPASNY